MKRIIFICLIANFIAFSTVFSVVAFFPVECRDNKNIVCVYSELNEWDLFERRMVDNNWNELIPESSSTGMPRRVKQFYKPYSPGLLAIKNIGSNSVYICRKNLFNGLDVFDAAKEYPGNSRRSLMTFSNINDITSLLTCFSSLSILTLFSLTQIIYAFMNDFEQPYFTLGILEFLIINALGIREVSVASRMFSHFYRDGENWKKIRNAISKSLLELTETHIELKPGEQKKLVVFVEKDKIDSFKSEIISNGLTVYDKIEKCGCKIEENNEVKIDIDGLIEQLDRQGL